MRDHSQWFQVQRWKALSSALGFAQLGAGIKNRLIYIYIHSINSDTNDVVSNNDYIYVTFGMFVFTTRLEFNSGQVAPQCLVLPKTTQWK